MVPALVLVPVVWCGARVQLEVVCGAAAERALYTVVMDGGDAVQCEWTSAAALFWEVVIYGRLDTAPAGGRDASPRDQRVR